MNELELKFDVKAMSDGTPLQDLKQYLPEKTQKSIDENERNRRIIGRRLGNIRHGLSSAVPLLCRGADGCPYSRTCPLVEIGADFSDLLGDGCPLEKYYMTEWSAQLSRELQLDENQTVDKWAAMDIIKWMILQNRALELMKTRPEVTEMAVVGVDEQGNPVEAEQINILIKFINQCEASIQRSLKTLNATREAKAKTGGDTSLAAELAKLREKIHGIETEVRIEI